MSKTFTLLSTLLVSTVAFSQQDTVRTAVLDEVVVTANKTEQKQSTTGKVITVISKDMIEKSTGKTVAQVLNEQAGIVVNGALNNAGSVQTIFMRGGSAGRTLVLVDGIPVSDPSQINNDFDLNFLALNDVERIEICKGAQSTLYGSDAIAGVINIITTKTNITQPFNAKATVSAGSFGTFKTNLQVYGKDDKLTYTARYARLQTNGFSAAYDNTGNGNFDNDAYLGNIVNGTLQYQASSKFMVKAFSQYSEYTAGVDASSFTDKKFYDIRNNNHSTGGGFAYRNGGVALTGNYQYVKQRRTYDDNASAGSAIYSLNTYESASQFAELYTSVKLGKGFTAIGGVDYRYGSMNNQYRSVSSFGPYNSNFPDSTQNQKSAYASLLYSQPKFSVELGGRLTDHSRYGTHYTYTFNPAYNFSERYRVFASVASSFKAPSIYQIANVIKGVSLKAETATNYEAGIQQSLKKISNRVVVFHRVSNNGIDYNNVYPTSGYYNYLVQKTTGIEYEMRVELTGKLSLTGNYTFIASQESTQSRVTFKDTTYEYSLRRPKHAVNATLGYQFSKALYVSANGKYVSSRQDVGPYKTQDVSLDDYFIAGIYAEYKFSGLVKVFGDIQNLGNRRFFDVRGYNTIPRIFNIGATLNL